MSKKKNKLLLHNTTNNHEIEKLFNDLKIQETDENIINLKDNETLYYNKNILSLVNYNNLYYFDNQKNLYSISNLIERSKKTIFLFIFEHPYKLILKNINAFSININFLENDIKLYVENHKLIIDHYRNFPNISLLINEVFINKSFKSELILLLRKINFNLNTIKEETKEVKILSENFIPKLDNNIIMQLDDNIKKLLNEALEIYNQIEFYTGIKYIIKDQIETNSKNDEKDFLLTKINILQNELEKYYLSKQVNIPQKNNYIGAEEIIKKQKAYRIGEKIIQNHSSLFGLLKLPFILTKEEKIQDEELTIELEDYSDYKEAEKIKNYLRYKLGVAYLNNKKSLLKKLRLPLLLIKISKEHNKGKK